MFVFYFIGVTQFLAFLINTVLGILVLTKNPRARAHQAYFVFALGAAGWILALYLTIFKLADPLIAGRVAFASASIMLAGLLWFTADYPQGSKHLGMTHAVAMILGIVFAALSLSPFMILKSWIVDNSYISGEFSPAPYAAWILFYLGSLVFMLVRAWRGVRRSFGLARRQYRAIALGVTIFFVVAIFTNLLMPALFNDFRWNGLGPVFTFAIIALVGHSMLSYRMFDVRLILKRGLVFSLAGSVMVAIVFFCSFLLAQIVAPQYAVIIGVLLLMLLYRPVYHKMNDLISHVIARGSYVYNDAVLEVTKLANEHLEMDVLNDLLLKTLEKLFRFDGATIVVFAPNTTNVVAKKMQNGDERGMTDVPELVRVLKGYPEQIVEADELDWTVRNDGESKNARRDRATLDLMRSIHASILIPFRVNGVIIGLLWAGEKQSHEPLTITDHRLLEIVGRTLAPALANAARFVAMERLNVDLTIANRAKGDFIDVVSHQFRTPLTEIAWNTEIIMDDPKTPVAIREELGSIKEGARKLSTTLTSIFDVLDLESGSMAFKRECVPIDEAIQKTLHDHEMAAKAKNIKIRTDVAPVSARADAQRLHEVLDAVIANAVAYTPNDGTVTVSAAICQEKTARAVEIVIADTGIGIPKKDLARVFEKFYRGKEAKHAAADGAGLGLFVAKNFVERMNGSISLESEEGKGTTVRLRLPLCENGKKNG